jgi:hypothetical protein
MKQLNDLLSDAIIGIDTLWGGDITAESGVNRLLADSWLSDRPLPRSFNSSSAAAVRLARGVDAESIDTAVIDRFLDDVDLDEVLAQLKACVTKMSGLRREYLLGICSVLEIMWLLALEKLGRGDPVPYSACVLAATGVEPRPSDARPLRLRLTEALLRHGNMQGDLPTAVDQWRQEKLVTAQRMPSLFRESVKRLDDLVRRNLQPHLPSEFHDVPRANCELRPIPNAYFSGCLNYVGRRSKAGELQYDANLDINSSLELSEAEFENLICHEVVPGHVTTFAYLQNLYSRGVIDFEASIVTMNTRASCLFEGIANNAFLIANGIRDVDDINDVDHRIAYLLGLLEDAAKNQASYMTWQDRVPSGEVVSTLRHDFLLSPERAQKIGSVWAGQPLLGRMSLPIYVIGTEGVNALLRVVCPSDLFPSLYGLRGAADIVTVKELVRQQALDAAPNV